MRSRLYSWASSAACMAREQRRTRGVNPRMRAVGSARPFACATARFQSGWFGSRSLAMRNAGSVTSCSFETAAYAVELDHGGEHIYHGANREQRGDIGNVVGRGNLDGLHGYDAFFGYAVQDGERFTRKEPAG